MKITDPVCSVLRLMVPRFTMQVLFVAAAVVVPTAVHAFECVDFEARPWSQFISADAGDCAENEVEGRCMDLDEVTTAVETDAGQTLERPGPTAPGTPLVAGACFDPIRCEGIPAQPTPRLGTRLQQSGDGPADGSVAARRGWIHRLTTHANPGLGASADFARTPDEPPRA